MNQSINEQRETNENQVKVMELIQGGISHDDNSATEMLSFLKSQFENTKLEEELKVQENHLKKEM
jgi:hypothetical protein